MPSEYRRAQWLKTNHPVGCNIGQMSIHYTHLRTVMVMIMIEIQKKKAWDENNVIFALEQLILPEAVYL